MKRHHTSKHFSWEVVSSLLEGLMSKLVEKNIMGDQERVEENIMGNQEMVEEITIDDQEIVEEERSRQHSHKLVSSLLEGLLSEVVGDNIEDQQETESAQPVSYYEQVRNRRVAEIQEEFDRQFPTFREEVRELRVVKKKRRKSNISNPPASAARKSSRIHQLSRSVGNREAVDEQELSPEEPRLHVIEEADLAEKEAVVEGAGDQEVAGTGTGDIEASVEEVPGTGSGDKQTCDEDSTGMEAGDMVNDAIGADDIETGVASFLGKFACIPCELSFR